MEARVSPPQTMPQYDKDNGNAGLLVPTSRGWAFNTRSLTANRCYYQRFVPSRNMTIVSAAIDVTVAAGANDDCAVAIYSSGGTRLATSGAVASKLNSTGVKTVSLSASLTVIAGTVYYLAFSVGTFGGTGASVLGCGFSDVNGTSLFGSTMGLMEAGYEDSAHPPPSTGAPSPGFISAYVAAALRET